MTCYPKGYLCFCTWDLISDDARIVPYNIPVIDLGQTVFVRDEYPYYDASIKQNVSQFSREIAELSKFKYIVGMFAVLF